MGNLDQAICPRAATVGFWDGYARWYKLWMEHTRYHDKILDVLISLAAPRWKVLDIGAGNGVLSMPLCAIGCDVAALEPSEGMRSLLAAEAIHRGIDWITFDERAWEDVPLWSYRDMDLIMACNSLHLTSFGFAKGLDRIFKFLPKRVFAVTELCPAFEVDPAREGYELVLSMQYQAESSFAYHRMSEAVHHWTYKKGTRLTPTELRELSGMMTYRDEHYWINDRATVGMFWWERNSMSNREAI